VRYILRSIVRYTPTLAVLLDAFLFMFPLNAPPGPCGPFPPCFWWEVRVTPVWWRPHHSSAVHHLLASTHELYTQVHRSVHMHMSLTAAHWTAVHILLDLGGCITPSLLGVH
jgi:hypothetical protein